jgi:hypothetical protein
MPDPISISLNIVFYPPANITVVVIGHEYIDLPPTAVARHAFFAISCKNLKKYGQSVISGLKGMLSYNLVYGGYSFSIEH